jgi:hypothetical protein
MKAMRWQEIRAAHPDQWLVIEALEAHSENDHRIYDALGLDSIAESPRWSDFACLTSLRYSPEGAQVPPEGGDAIRKVARLNVRL